MKTKPAEAVQWLPLDKLLPTPDNRRQRITAASVESLAASIKAHGVLQPLIVRVHPTQAHHWEIRAGERRWKAAKLAGLKAVPALVRELDDQAAFEVLVIENLEREQLHPLEEAELFQMASERNYDLKKLAAQLGRKPEFVARRASLAKLTKTWKDAILKPDTEPSRLSVAHLELIARLPVETQATLSGNEFDAVFRSGFPTVDDLRRIIDRDLRSLQAMPWPLDDEALDPKAGACLKCPKRAGTQPLLFSPEDAPINGKPSKTDRCLDPACFDRKHVAHVRRCEAQLRQEQPDLKLVRLGIGSVGAALDDAYGGRAHWLHDPKFVKAGTPHSVPVMPIDGPKAGKLAYVAVGGPPPRTPPPRSAPRGRKSRPTVNRPVPLTAAERRAQLQQRRDGFVARAIEDRLRKFTVADVAALLAAKPKKDPVEALALVLAFGTRVPAASPHDGGVWEEYDRLCQSKPEDRVATAVYAVVQVWVRRLTLAGAQVAALAVEARRMFGLLGLDVAPIEAAAVQEVPDPQAAAGEKAAAKPVPAGAKA